MPGLTLYLSNRLENLSDRLAAIVREPADASLHPETIVVQSRGMQRWISMELAKRNGVCGNTSFPFPNTFLDTVFQKLFPDLPEISLFDPAMMTVQIMKTLPEMVRLPAFEPLRRYLQDDPKELKLFQLSDRIAATFDQYMVFRPQMILAWEKKAKHSDPENLWQPLLWREITRGKSAQHRTRLHRELLRLLENPAPVEALFPARINMFGISYLPPFHLQAFAAMARVAQVHIFLLNPCREYWADILDTRDIQRITHRYAIEEETEAYYYLDQGNPLLASMGTLGRDFLSLITDTDCEIADCFTEVDGRDLLTDIQSDILNLVNREASAAIGTAAADRKDDETHTEAPGEPKPDVGEPDDSIQIHACHSPLREIEVLHDRLLALFDSQPDLKPRDIVVMTPDIESYAPFIQAVFGTQSDRSSYIPYSIADQSARRTSPVIDAFMQLLSLKGSRFAVSQIQSVLELPGVKERFDFTRSDLDRITGWINDVHIHWGRDAEDRSNFDLPPFAANTWKAGMERLLLGIAMPDTGRRLFNGILPYDHIEGRDGQLLGKLLDFLRQLYRLSDTLLLRHSPEKWQRCLNEMLERFFLLDARSERDAHNLRQALESLGQMETKGKYDRELSLEVVSAYLEKCFQHSPHPSGFISGGVTFCAMLPMRSIPFRIVCLVGMNSEAIPRDQRPLGFDLIHRHPQPGDRSRRNDDKYLFLEAILSARRTLYISYVGQSIADNSHIPPSVLVSELIDYLHRGYGIDEKRIVLRHPLQAFSPLYFTGEDKALFSYSRENFEALGNRGQDRTPAPFFTNPLPEPSADSRTLTPEQLCRFFQHPVRYLLQQRLSLRLEEPATGDQDHEPFQLEGLARYKIGQELLERSLEGFDLDAYFAVQQATGSLPQGTVGDTTYRGLQSEAKDFAGRVASEVQDHKPRHRQVDLQIADFSLQGVIPDLYPGGRTQFRFARTKAADILSAWIMHLCLGHPADDRIPFQTTLVTRDSALRFGPVEQPGTILEDLLRIYWNGLHGPLHFFPDLSREYFRQTCEKGREPAAAMQAVRKRWTGDAYRRGALDDPYVRICFERMDPLDDSFQELAERIFFPIWQHTADG